MWSPFDADTQYFGPEFIKLTLIYTLISFLTTTGMLAWFRVGHALSRYFLNIDAVPILRACFLSASLPALAVFIFTRLENVPRSLPVIHFFVLSAAILGGRHAAQDRSGDIVAARAEGFNQSLLEGCFEEGAPARFA